MQISSQISNNQSFKAIKIANTQNRVKGVSTNIEIYKLTNDKKELINNNEMQKIIDKAHKLPYGDVLVEFLNMFVDAFAKHVHPYPGMPPCQTSEYIETTTYDLKKILSENVAIN